ncbi:unnamed protein product, partial [Amoebophrya sp. A25]
LESARALLDAHADPERQDLHGEDARFLLARGKSDDDAIFHLLMTHEVGAGDSPEKERERKSSKPTIEIATPTQRLEHLKRTNLNGETLLHMAVLHGRAALVRA